MKLRFNTEREEEILVKAARVKAEKSLTRLQNIKDDRNLQIINTVGDGNKAKKKFKVDEYEVVEKEKICS